METFNKELSNNRSNMLLLDNKPDTSIDIVKIYEKVSRKSSKNEEVHCIEEDPCSPNLNDEDDYEPEFGIYLDIGKTTDKLYTLLDRCLTKDILNDVIGTLEPMAIVHKQELLDMGILSRISSLISEHHKTKSNDEIMGLLLMVLKIFLFGKDKPKFYQANRLIQHASIMEELMESNIFCILEEGFKNTSVSDISERLGLYKALLAISASLSSCPEFVPYFFQLKDSRSIAGIFAEFCSVLNNYLCLATDKQTVDPELIGFINQADDLFLAMKKLASNDDQPPKIKKTKLANDLVNVEASTSENISTEDLNKIYAESLRFYQIQSFKMHGRYHRSLAEELNQSDPHSAASTPRSNRIAKELASMYHALPLGSSGSIFICLDEERCDVLKALISGPEDTPYANGLFEFDVFFPNSYPNSPPKCQCMTSGNRIRFNPNLYSCGKVCLSILGTWPGSPEEQWRPNSSLLQVLISIQGLILVKEPYCNEPSYEQEKNTASSKAYNIDIEYATLVYAIYEQYQSCLPYFEKVIKRHFWLKRKMIIEQAQNWIVTYTNENKDTRYSHSHMVDHEPEFNNPEKRIRNVQKLIDEFRQMKNPMPNQPVVNDKPCFSIEK